MALGLVGMIGLVACAVWLTVADMPAASGTTQHVRGIAPGVRALTAVPTPQGSTVAFGQVWTAGDGNTIVAGEPKVGISDSALRPGAPVIRVAVTLTNNGDQEWSPAVTTFSGTLNRAPVLESDEGDWNYSTPIVARTSVTLSKVFLGDGGQFTLAVHTPQGVAVFTGRA